MGSIAKKGLQQYLLLLQHHPEPRLLSHLGFFKDDAITVEVLSMISDIVLQKLIGIQKLQIRRLLLKVVRRRQRRRKTAATTHPSASPPLHPPSEFLSVFSILKEEA
ncbi:hypothetical protein ACFX14_037284 [Malus domestica]